MRAVAFLFILVLVSWDLAAVHDILQGETDLRLEFAILVVSSISFGVMGWIAWKQKVKAQQPDSMT